MCSNRLIHQNQEVEKNPSGFFDLVRVVRPEPREELGRVPRSPKGRRLLRRKIPSAPETIIDVVRTVDRPCRRQKPAPHSFRPVECGKNLPPTSGVKTGISPELFPHFLELFPLGPELRLNGARRRPGFPHPDWGRNLPGPAGFGTSILATGDLPVKFCQRSNWGYFRIQFRPIRCPVPQKKLIMENISGFSGFLWEIFSIKNIRIFFFRS